MTFTPSVIEPGYVRYSGFRQDLSVGGGLFYASVLAQRRDVSKLATDTIWDAIHGDTAAERLGTRIGWNYMTRDHVPGFNGGNFLIQAPPVGVDPQLIIKIRGGLAGTPGKVSTSVQYGAGIVADRVVVTLEGGIFESDDPDDADLIFWWGLHAVGLGLGLNEANNDLDIMFPRFRGEADSAGPNFFISDCDITVLKNIIADTIPANLVELCGGEPLPSAAALNDFKTVGAISCTTNQTFFMDGQSMIVTVTVLDTATDPLPNALVTVGITGGNGNKYEARGVTNGSGVMTSHIQVGGAFGLGDYFIKPTVVAGDVSVVGAVKTVLVED